MVASVMQPRIIALSVVREVEALLKFKTLRGAAAAVGISHESARAIKLRKHYHQRRAAMLKRCPGCGGKHAGACRVCDLRKLA